MENNRRQGWDYAADGQETHSTGPGVVLDHTYNATGRMVQLKQTVTATSQISTHVTSYNGDGNLVREFLQEDPTNSTSYKVRSSVLGEVVTWLNNAGNKTGTIVHIDERVTPTRMNSTDTGNVPFPTYEDPLRQSIAGDKKAVYDPLGNHILWQPSPQGGPPPNSYPRSSASFGSLGSLWGNAQESSCQMDGIPTRCDLAMSLLNNGSAMQCPQNNCGPRFVRTTNIFGEPISQVSLPFVAFGDGAYGFFFGGWEETPQEQAAALFAPVTHIDGAPEIYNFGPQEPAKPSHDRGSRTSIVSQLTAAQCVALRKLLSREAELGTIEAAARSQISYPYPNNDWLMNDFNSSANPNIIVNDGTQIDLDWWTTLAGVSAPDASIISVHNTFVLAKTTGQSPNGPQRATLSHTKIPESAGRCCIPLLISRSAACLTRSLWSANADQTHDTDDDTTLDSSIVWHNSPGVIHGMYSNLYTNGHRECLEFAEVVKSCRRILPCEAGTPQVWNSGGIVQCRFD